MRPLSPGSRGGNRMLWEGGRHSRGAQEHRGDSPDSLLHTGATYMCWTGKCAQTPLLPRLPPSELVSGAPRQIPWVQFFLQPEACFISSAISSSQVPTAEPCTQAHGACVLWVCAHRNTCRHVQEPSAHNTDAHRRRHAHRHTDSPPFSPCCHLLSLGTLAWVLLDPAGSSSHLQLGWGQQAPQF